jgi:choline dehydrogenase-like flavoprotein
VVAGRLAKADLKLEILVVEAGFGNDNALLTTPAYAWTNLANTSSPFYDHYVSAPSEFLNGREVVVDTGRVLGGGSSVNIMMYARPAASDLDDWNTEGWSFVDLKPFFKKVHGLNDRVIVSSRLTGSKEAIIIMAMKAPFRFHTEAPGVMLLATSLPPPNNIRGLNQSSIYRTLGRLIAPRS